MRPQRQHVAPRDRPFILHPSPGVRLAKLSPSLRTSLLTVAFLFALWLGSIAGSAWSTSHPCLSVPGSVITGVILDPKSLGPLGENRQDIACGVDGRVKWVTMYISADKVEMTK